MSANTALRPSIATTVTPKERAPNTDSGTALSTAITWNTASERLASFEEAAIRADAAISAVARKAEPRCPRAAT